MKPIENSNLNDWSCTKRMNWADQAQREKHEFMWRIGNEKIDYSKKVVQDIAKALKNYEESVAKKQIEPDN